jgi:hypothetical protein
MGLLRLQLAEISLMTGCSLISRMTSDCRKILPLKPRLIFSGLMTATVTADLTGVPISKGGPDHGVPAQIAVPHLSASTPGEDGAAQQSKRDTVLMTITTLSIYCRYAEFCARRLGILYG